MPWWKKTDPMPTKIHYIPVAGAALLFLCAHTGLAAAPQPTPSEMEDASQWAAAKFGTESPAREFAGSLQVLANNDPVQLNRRAGKPLRLSATQYTRGLYCHANSRIAVRLPSPGAEFSAMAGVDSNEQTSGGRGSVHFAVVVGAREKFKSELLREGMPAAPVKVDLEGATEFELVIDDGGDGIACDQADWAEASVRLKNGRQLWLADLGLGGRTPAAGPPFSFTLDGKSSAEFLKNWKVSRSTRNVSPGKVEHTTRYTDETTGLQTTCIAIVYRDFPTVEWTVYLKNTGTSDSPMIENLQALDARWEGSGGKDFTLHHALGTFVAAKDFQPLTTVIGKNQAERFAPSGGRPCARVWPYFNLESGNGDGVIMAVGWPGQWAASFVRADNPGLQVTAGQERTHFRLHPGEQIRTPLIVLQFWRGDWLQAQNVWRRWMVAHNIPRVDGKAPPPLLTPCSSHQFAEMVNADEASQKLFIDRYQEEGLGIDYWWMDAGWYPHYGGGWPRVGTWLVDSNRFPNGLRAVTDHGRAKGVKSIVWFEPERVTEGTMIYNKYPNWLLGKGGTKLFNLGDDKARTWLTDWVDTLIREQGIDLYRQDFNMDPLDCWRSGDTEDRQGITENHYVTGYLAYWDALRQRHPGMLIDSCASGGHRNDLETMRRSLPFLRSDFIFDPVGNQCHTYGLSLWLPYHGTGTAAPRQFSLYELRSNMSCPKQTPCYDVRDRTLPYETLRKVVREWRSFADDYLADYYPLTPYSLEEDAWMAWQFDNPERGKGVVQAFRRSRSIYTSAQVKLQGLDPEKRYQITDLDDSASSRTVLGRDLMKTGLTMNIEEQPGAKVWTYKATQ